MKKQIVISDFHCDFEKIKHYAMHDTAAAVELYEWFEKQSKYVNLLKFLWLLNIRSAKIITIDSVWGFSE